MSEHGKRSTSRVIRILVPVTAAWNSLWGIRYVLVQSQSDVPMEVILLNVGERITDWRVLQYRTHEELLKFQQERAEAIIEDASQPLIASGVPCRGLFKQGDIVRTILDTADELECDEIVIPKQWCGLLGFLTRGIRSVLISRDRVGRVVQVNHKGIGEKRNALISNAGRCAA